MSVLGSDLGVDNRYDFDLEDARSDVVGGAEGSMLDRLRQEYEANIRSKTKNRQNSRSVSPVTRSRLAETFGQLRPNAINKKGFKASATEDKSNGSSVAFRPRAGGMKKSSSSSDLAGPQGQAQRIGKTGGGPSQKQDPRMMGINGSFAFDDNTTSVLSMSGLRITADSALSRNSSQEVVMRERRRKVQMGKEAMREGEEEAEDDAAEATKGPDPLRGAQTERLTPATTSEGQQPGDQTDAAQRPGIGERFGQMYPKQIRDMASSVQDAVSSLALGFSGGGPAAANQVGRVGAGSSGSSGGEVRMRERTRKPRLDLQPQGVPTKANAGGGPPAQPLLADNKSTGAAGGGWGAGLLENVSQAATKAIQGLQSDADRVGKVLGGEVVPRTAAGVQSGGQRSHDLVQGAGRGVAGAAKGVQAGTQRALEGGAQNIQNAQKALVQNVQNTQKAIGEGVQNTQKAIGDTVQNTQKAIGDTVQNTQKAIGSSVQNTQKAIADTVQNTQKAIGSSVQNTQKAIGAGVHNSQKAIGDTVQNTQKAIGDTVQNTQKAIGSSVQNTQKAIGDTVQNTQKAIGDTVQNTQKALQGGAQNVQKAVEEGQKNTQKLLEGGVKNIQGAQQGVKAVVEGGQKNVQALAAGVSGAVQGASQGAQKAIAESGRNLTQAMETGSRSVQGLLEGAPTSGPASSSSSSTSSKHLPSASEPDTNTANRAGQTHETARSVIDKIKDSNAKEASGNGSSSPRGKEKDKDKEVSSSSAAKEKGGDGEKKGESGGAGRGAKSKEPEFAVMGLEPDELDQVLAANMKTKSLKNQADGFGDLLNKIAGRNDRIPEKGFKDSKEAPKRALIGGSKPAPVMLNVTVKKDENDGKDKTGLFGSSESKKVVVPAIAATVSTSRKDAYLVSDKDAPRKLVAGKGGTAASAQLEMDKGSTMTALMPAETRAPRLATNTSLTPSKSTALVVHNGGSGALMSPGDKSASALAADAMAGHLTSALPTDPHSRSGPMMQLAKAEAEEAEAKRQATERIKAAWKEHEERNLAMAERKVARAVIKRHVVAKVTRQRFLELKNATIACQSVRRGTLARKQYSEMWVKIAIKEGVGYLLGLRKAKFDIYYGFARREAAFVLQTWWHRRQARAQAQERRRLEARERLGVLLDLWDQAGAPLQDRSKSFERLLDSALDSLRGLSAIRAAVLQAANVLPAQHLKAEAARQMFTFSQKYYDIVDTFPGDDRRNPGSPSNDGPHKALTPEEIEKRHVAITKEREIIYHQLKDLPVRDMRLLYWEWGISLQEKSRMQTLVMQKLWRDPDRAEQSEQLMKVVAELPPPRTSSKATHFFHGLREGGGAGAAPVNYTHAMRQGGQAMRSNNNNNNRGSFDGNGPQEGSRGTGQSVASLKTSVLGSSSGARKGNVSPSRSDAWESESNFSRSSMGTAHEGMVNNSGRSTSRGRRGLNALKDTFSRKHSHTNAEPPSLAALDMVSSDVNEVSFDVGDAFASADAHRGRDISSLPMPEKVKSSKNPLNFMNCARGSHFTID